MRDTPEELDALESAPALRAALETLAAEITGQFEEADRLALKHQKSYRRTTWVATTFGTLAILLAIAGIVAERFGHDEAAELLLGLESGSLIVAAASVLRGLFAYRHENWLVERFRAERLRALKFTHLIDPLLWSADEHERNDWRERLRADVERARVLRHPDLKLFAAVEDVPAMRLPERQVSPDPGLLDALISYYHRKRLAPQRDYFLRVALQGGHSSARLLPLFFFGAVSLVLLHAILAVVGHVAHLEPIAVAGTWLAAASIAVPVLWAGIRTYHGANEVSRNAARSRARHAALAQLSERLLSARDDHVEALWTMRLTEFILQIDQKEWLRLLGEAEWYG